MRRSHLTETFPSQPGTNSPQRIAVLGAQHLAVRAVDDQDVVHHLADRHGPRVSRAVGAFEQHPFGGGLQPRFVEQPRHRDAGPLAAGEQAVRLLHSLRGRLDPVGETVPGALEKVEARHRRVAHQVAHGELERLADHAVHHQPVRRRVDVRRAGVVALEDHAVRGDDAMLVLKRAHAPVRPVLPVRQDIGAAARDLLLELRRGSISPLLDRPAHLPGRGLDRERRPAGGGGDAADGERAARHRGALAEKRPAVPGLEPRFFLAGQHGPPGYGTRSRIAGHGLSFGVRRGSLPRNQEVFCMNRAIGGARPNPLSPLLMRLRHPPAGGRACFVRKRGAPAGTALDERAAPGVDSGP